MWLLLKLLVVILSIIGCVSHSFAGFEEAIYLFENPPAGHGEGHKGDRGDEHSEHRAGIVNGKGMKDILWLETKADSSYVGTERIIEVRFGKFPGLLKKDDDIGNTLLWAKTGSSISELRLQKQRDEYIVKIAPESAGYYTVAAYADFGIRDKFHTCYFSKVDFPFYGRRGGEKYEPIIFDKDKLPLEILIINEAKHNRRYTGDELTVRVLYRGRPLSDAELCLITDSGWTKGIRTDANGEGRFALLTDRAILLKEHNHNAVMKYMFWVEHTDNNKGKGYKGNRYISTLVISVYPSPHAWESSKVGYLTVLATTLIVGLGVSLRRYLRRRDSKRGR
ncbi:MAG: hypothetical protein AB1488_03550 [Nitrospirota bacterium]